MNLVYTYISCNVFLVNDKFKRYTKRTYVNRLLNNRGSMQILILVIIIILFFLLRLNEEVVGLLWDFFISQYLHAS